MNKLTYEDASKELNEIIEKIENGDVSVSEINDLLERGKNLLNVCYSELDKVKGKLSEVREIMGKLEEV